MAQAMCVCARHTSAQWSFFKTSIRAMSGFFVVLLPLALVLFPHPYTVTHMSLFQDARRRPPLCHESLSSVPVKSHTQKSAMITILGLSVLKAHTSQKGEPLVTSFLTMLSIFRVNDGLQS
eukprot:1737816-Amphidinium_carterae.1